LRREWTDEALAKALAGRPAAPIRDVVGFSSKALKQPNPNKVWMEVTLGTGKVVRGGATSRSDPVMALGAPPVFEFDLESAATPPSPDRRWRGAGKPMGGAAVGRGGGR
jgi:hypothetical protein